MKLSSISFSVWEIVEVMELGRVDGMGEGKERWVMNLEGLA
jgi:hypothetical protein